MSETTEFSEMLLDNDRKQKLEMDCIGLFAQVARWTDGGGCVRTMQRCMLVLNTILELESSV